MYSICVPHKKIGQNRHRTGVISLLPPTVITREVHHNCHHDDRLITISEHPWITPTYLLPSMACGKPLSDDLRNVVLTLTQRLDVNSIRDYTGLKKCTIQRILEDYRKRRTVSRAWLGRRSMCGQHRVLTTNNMRVILLSLGQFSKLTVNFVQVSCRHHPTQPRPVSGWDARAIAGEMWSRSLRRYTLEGYEAIGIHNEEGMYPTFTLAPNSSDS